MGPYSINHLLVRADGSNRIGTGHVMRCLALAQAWQEIGGVAHFALADITSPLEARLIAERMELHHLTVMPGSADDAAQTITVARQFGASWVVIDGYHLGADYQRALKQAGLRLLVVDDYGHASHYSADLVLNQNISAVESLYVRRERYTRLLLGPRYALLRREFWPWRGWQREIPSVARKVLVTLGGSDPDNVTLKVIHALQSVKIEGLEAVVVIGGSNQHGETLQAAVDGSGCAIRLEHNVTGMPELMAWADMAVSAGGSTCWELALLGVPALLLILADNQQAVAASLDSAGIVINLGRSDNLTPIALAQALTGLALAPNQRAIFARHGQELVDGKGAARVVQQVENVEADLTSGAGRRLSSCLGMGE
jgi:UDP-2,4-diacetamido-2,4,6-trideoxy-beta-L-altropyranose hydrolase